MSELFMPVARSEKVECVICGSRGYQGGRWQEPHRRGHAACPRCGKVLSVLCNGQPRTHGRCGAR